MANQNEDEEVYVKGLQKIFSDPDTLAALEKDPEGTLKELGFHLDDRALAELAKGTAQPELGVAAVPAVLVRVATKGTRPAVSVVVRSSTFAATRRTLHELDE